MQPACAAALAALDQFIDGELDSQQHEAVERHLGDCGPCRAECDVQLMIKTSVHDCMQPEPAPTALVEHVRLRIRSTRVEWTSQIVVKQTIRIEFRDN